VRLSDARVLDVGAGIEAIARFVPQSGKATEIDADQRPSSQSYVVSSITRILPSFDAENARVALSALKRGGIGVDFWVMSVWKPQN
jgi:hypothetical protein